MLEEDYRKKFLFLLCKFFISVLWRASISSLPEYDRIQLGEYEEIAFKILKDEENFEDLFKVFIFKFPNNLEYNKCMYMNKTKILGRKAYVVCMAGYLINVILNGKNLPNNTVFKDMFITEKGFYILESLDMTNTELLKQIKTIEDLITREYMQLPEAEKVNAMSLYKQLKDLANHFTGMKYFQKTD